MASIKPLVAAGDNAGQKPALHEVRSIGQVWYHAIFQNETQVPWAQHVAAATQVAQEMLIGYREQKIALLQSQAVDFTLPFHLEVALSRGPDPRAGKKIARKLAQVIVPFATNDEDTLEKFFGKLPQLVLGLSKTFRNKGRTADWLVFAFDFSIMEQSATLDQLKKVLEAPARPSLVQSITRPGYLPRN
jgi:hypothetical protein